MTHSFLRILATINRVLTTINGFLFGILLFGGGSPIHSRKGKALRIPLHVNVVLLVALVIVLALLFRAYGFFELESTKAVPTFS